MYITTVSSFRQLKWDSYSVSLYCSTEKLYDMSISCIATHSYNIYSLLWWNTDRTIWFNTQLISFSSLCWLLTVHHCWHIFRNSIVFSKFLSPIPLLFFLSGTTSAKTTRSKSQSWAVKWLWAHNRSLEEERRSRSHSSHHLRSQSPVVEHIHDQPARGPSQSSDDSPDWAKELLLQQKEYGKELKRLKAELASKPNKAGKHKVSIPELKFNSNKKQYQL